MTNYRRLGNVRKILIGVFFTAILAYLILFNRYHYFYQEQIQLFRFDWNYFTNFLTKPGGLTEYLGAFFIQFYLCLIIGPLIATITGFAIFILSNYILRKYKSDKILWSLVPVLLLVGLQSDPFFSIVYSFGLLIALTFVAIYISINRDPLRYIIGVTGLFFLYLTIGGGMLFVAVLCIIHELLFAKSKYRLFIASGYALMGFLIPYFCWHYIYFITLSEAWLNLILIPSNNTSRIAFLLILIYYPLLLIGMKKWITITKKPKFVLGWNYKTILLGVLTGIIVIITIPQIKRLFAYNHKIEVTLGIDYCIQHAEWNKVPQISLKYKGTDRLITYLTNLSLLKLGHLPDQMFHYNQIGPQGLYLDWIEDNITPFYGCEIFYLLGYNNEAYRWAFEAFVATGQSPRLLKRLIITSIINGTNKIAEKYINVLNQTLFYKKWATRYREYLYEPNSLLHEGEIIQHRELIVHDDFFYDLDNFNFNLIKLLENHPSNRKAFEYYMAFLLLEKNLPEFVANITRLKEFGFKGIPVHYEEALLIYIVNTNLDVVPEGYTIRESTTKRFVNYLNTFSPYLGKPELEGAQALSKQYGNTYWFYSQFY